LGGLQARAIARVFIERRFGLSRGDQSSDSINPRRTDKLIMPQWPGEEKRDHFTVTTE
jgi:hypothetical protein